MTRQVSLLVNDTPVSLDYFVQAFIDHAVSGMMEALEGTGQIKNLSLSIDGDKLAIVINGATVPTNPFVTKIIRSTILGMASSLKGVRETTKLQLNVKR